MELSPDNAALIVIDMQKSFCEPDGKVAAMGLDTSACAAAIRPCGEVISAARKARLPIIFTRYVYTPDYSDGGVMVQHKMPGLAEHRALVAGTADAEIVDELAPQSGDIVIDKNRPSSFYGTQLDEILERQGIKQLVVCGVTTNCCVETTVRDASQRDLEVFVVGEACGELDEERHNVALRAMDMLFADVISIDQMRVALEKAAA
ncbi:cysteine hydrolase family protein [Altererythrobacter sp. GH1-8]|uniref:cysteine hydrolase family protein n=1 Tax=Altererythrobacter sp. GH1-8 TaxID=3349333 RepID=UPI00374DB441